PAVLGCARLTPRSGAEDRHVRAKTPSGAIPAELPSSACIAQRFGGCMRAYALAGYVPPPDSQTAWAAALAARGRNGRAPAVGGPSAPARWLLLAGASSGRLAKACGLGELRALQAVGWRSHRVVDG